MERTKISFSIIKGTKKKGNRKISGAFGKEQRGTQQTNEQGYGIRNRLLRLVTKEMQEKQPEHAFFYYRLSHIIKTEIMILVLGP